MYIHRKTSEIPYSPMPEQQLRFLSMTEDIDDKYVMDRYKICKEQIQPWRNQHQNPSESPQRRLYAPRPAISHPKIDKALLKLAKTPTKVLQSNNNSNLSFRVKSTIQKAVSTSQRKIQQENEIVDTPKTFRRKLSIQKPPQIAFYIEEKTTEKEQKQSSYHTLINPILYPLVSENKKKKRLFRKMDKFQNFVSVSLRK